MIEYEEPGDQTSMKEAIKVFVCSHNHVPYGASHDVYENNYIQNIKPFITALYRYPRVPALLHYSGPVYEYLLQEHGEFFMLLEELVNRKQVEILGGGYYEPMFPLLSLTDRIGQIEKLTTFIRQHFGKRPRGCWIPRSMWEEDFPAFLNTCGMDYTILDEENFKAAGVSEGELYYPYLTEDQGKVVWVYPVASVLSSQFEPKNFRGQVSRILTKGAFLEIKKGTPQEFKTLVFRPELRAQGLPSEQDRELFYAQLFAELSEEHQGLECTLPNRLQRLEQGFRKVYFPSTHARKRLLQSKGANYLYGKIVYLHTLVNQLRGDKSRKKSAREELWKAQGCDSFFSDAVNHGQWGVKRQVYRSLLEAEKITRDRGVFLPSVVRMDFDFDGRDEYLLQGTDLNCYIHHRGASVIELDYISRLKNYVEFFSEGEQEGGALFKDVLFSPELTLFHYKAQGRDCKGNTRWCGEEWYENIEIDRVHQSVGLVSPLPVDDTYPYGEIRIYKKFELKKNALCVQYRLKNTALSPKRFNFTTQIHLPFLGCGLNRFPVEVLRNGNKTPVLGHMEHLKDVEEVLIHDYKNDTFITLGGPPSFDLWLIPHCQDEQGEDTYYYVSFLPLQQLILAPEEEKEFSFFLKFSNQST